MGKVTIAVVGALLSAGAWAEEPKAPASFEQARRRRGRASSRGGDLTDRFDPLFAECKRDDDLEARQCAAVRDATLERLRGATFVALGDESSLSWTPWTASEKQIGLELHGCLACGRPLMLGDAAGGPKPRFVTTRVPKAIKAGKAVGLDVGFYGVPLPDQPTAARWVKQVMPRLVTQFVFRVGPVWKSGSGDKTFEGVTFVPVAQRVFDRCSGKVYASEPPSAKAAEPQPDKSCPGEGAGRRRDAARAALARAGGQGHANDRAQDSRLLPDAQDRRAPSACAG